MVYDIKNHKLRTGLRPVMPTGFESPMWSGVTVGRTDGLAFSLSAMHQLDPMVVRHFVQWVEPSQKPSRWPIDVGSSLLRMELRLQ
jgi:hypothetical protein